MKSNLMVTNKEKDLGVVMDRLMKMATHCSAKQIENKTISITVPLHNTVMQPHLEYCILVSSPPLKKNIAGL